MDQARAVGISEAPLRSEASSPSARFRSIPLNPIGVNHHRSQLWLAGEGFQDGHGSIVTVELGADRRSTFHVESSSLSGTGSGGTHIVGP